LHTVLSPHAVPLATGVCVTPVEGSHESVVQGFSSSVVGGVPATQVPVALHVSCPLHAVGSSQAVPVATAVCLTPLDASHESAVQGFSSSVGSGVPAAQVPVALHVSCPLQTVASSQAVPVPTGVCFTPATGSQLSAVHGLPSSVAGGVPGLHIPTWQVSRPLHTVASSQAVPFVTAVWITPATGSHESAVHELPSSMAGGVPAMHMPLALHVSWPSQTVASSQAVPAFTGVCVTPVVGAHESAVHGLPSVVVGGVPAMQLPPALHVSCPLHTVASSQAVPVVTGVCFTPAIGSHESAVQGLPSSVATGLPGVQLPTLHTSPDVHRLLSEQVVPSLLAGFEQTPVLLLQVPAL
jgi:hypothetical protein